MMPSKDETEKKPGLAVIGIGNILFKDEGLGIYATQFLKANYDFFPPLELIDGGTLGMNMIHYYQCYEQVLILDTLSVEEESPAGTVYNLGADVLQGMGNFRKTAHEIEVLQTLELGTLAGDMAEIQIVAMVPKDIDSVIMGLSEEVKQAVPLLIDTVIRELKNRGVMARPQKQMISLECIIDQYNQQQAPSCA